jgi:predicted phosphodiesterase
MKAKVLRLVTTLMMLAILARTAGAVQIVAGPYLQAPTETSMTVMWVTDQGCTSWVEFGQEDTLNQEAHHSRHGLIEADQTIHRITLEGLTPGTSYRYRTGSKEIVKFDPYEVTYGDTVYSDAYAFTTLNGKKEGISFVVLNDIHQRNEILVSLMKLAESKAYDLVFLNGDILGHIENQQQIINHVLAPCTDLFASQTPFVYVRGNHETRGRFARRLPDYLGSPNDRYYYSFDHGPVHFVVLDGGEDKQDAAEVYAGLVDFDRYRDVQQKWLRGEIQSEAFQRASFRVVLVHMPPKPSEDWHGPDDLYNKWRPVLNKGMVDLMICGHTHRYAIETPRKGVCDYPMIIGGAPEAGQATVIRVEATAKELDVTMTRDDGQIVGTYHVENKRKPQTQRFSED